MAVIGVLAWVFREELSLVNQRNDPLPQQNGQLNQQLHVAEQANDRIRQQSAEAQRLNEDLRLQNLELQNRAETICEICNRKVNFVLLPCSHVQTCLPCATSLRECPTCGLSINAYKRCICSVWEGCACIVQNIMLAWIMHNGLLY
eukprot:Platyproteum_vivax@DN13437_c0_g1_i1.p1